jgi:copper chaperone
MKEILKIHGMTCGHCVKAVEMELKELLLESFSVEIGKAEVEYDPEKVSHNEIRNSIMEAGYSIEE